MTTLRLVDGKTYMAPTIFGSDRIIQKGETVEVEDPKHVEILLADSYLDAANNECFYFVEVGSDAEQAAKAGKKMTPSRRARAAAKETEEEAAPVPARRTRSETKAKSAKSA